jgi:Co/Zn/Cd efflux system component
MEAAMACCEQSCTPAPKPDSRFRKALWIALVLNALMFGVEWTGGLSSDSRSLLADAIDFLGDAANYAISLSVLALGAMWRARAALLKGVSMGLYGVGVLAAVAYGILHGNVPEPVTMGVIGALALATNVGVVVLLYAFREGDANMRSVWLCTRNDAIGNLAVLAAASGVGVTGSAWPDLVVAAIMAMLALTAAFSVVGQARGELAQGVRP